jgi:hypothetical protein
MGVTVLMGMTVTALHSRAAEPPRPRAYLKAVAAPLHETLPMVDPVSPINTFEIAPYLRNNQKLPADSAEFNYALRHQNGWRSALVPSDKDADALVDDCRHKNMYCDVVLLIETDEENEEMSIKVLVSSTPPSHQDFHTRRLDISDKPIPCNIHDLGGQEHCRKILVNTIVLALVGLDKVHTAPNGAR